MAGFDSLADLELAKFLQGSWYVQEQVRKRGGGAATAASMASTARQQAVQRVHHTHLAALSACMLLHGRGKP
jgi:hypothetical protein